MPVNEQPYNLGQLNPALGLDPALFEGLNPQQIVDLLASNPGHFGASDANRGFYGNRGPTSIFLPNEGFESGYYSRKGAGRGGFEGVENPYVQSGRVPFSSRDYTWAHNPQSGEIAQRRYGGSSSGFFNELGDAAKSIAPYAATAAGLYYGAPLLGKAASTIADTVFSPGSGYPTYPGGPPGEYGQGNSLFNSLLSAVAPDGANTGGGGINWADWLPAIFAGTGLAANLFGDAETSASTTATQSLSPQQQGLINPSTQQLLSFLQNPPSVGARPVVGLNDLQLQGRDAAIGSIGDVLGRYDQSLQGLTGSQDFGQQIQQNYLSGNVNNPYFDQALSSTLRPITEALTEQILPNVRSGAIGAGQFGGSRQALGEDSAVRGYVDRATSALAPLQSQLHQQTLNAATSASALSPTLAQAIASLGERRGLYPSSVYSTFGGQQQQLDQQRADARYNANLANQFLPYTIAQDIFSTGVGLPGGTTTTNSQSKREGLLF